MGTWTDCMKKFPLSADEQRELLEATIALRKMVPNEPANEKNIEKWTAAAATDMLANAEKEHQAVRAELEAAVKAGIIPLKPQVLPTPQIDVAMEQVRRQLTPEATDQKFNKEQAERRLQYIEKIGPDHIYEQFAAVLSNAAKSFKNLFDNRSLMHTHADATKGKNFWKIRADVPLSDVTVHYKSLTPSHLKQFEPKSEPRKLLEEIFREKDQKRRKKLYDEFIKEGYRVVPTGYTESQIQYVGEKPISEVVEPASARPVNMSPEAGFSGNTAWQRPRNFGDEQYWAKMVQGKKSTALWGTQIDLAKPEDIPRGRVTVAELSDKNPKAVERMRLAVQFLDMLVSRMMPNAKVVLADGHILPIKSIHWGHMARYGDIFLIEVHPNALVHDKLLTFLGALFHEFGHAFVYYAFKNLPFERQWAIYQEYRNFLKTMGRARATEGNAKWRFILARMNQAEAYFMAYGNPMEGLSPTYDTDYWYGFDEWIAEQVARWATEWAAKATGQIAQSFFEQIWQELTKVLTAIRDFVRKIPGREHTTLEEIQKEMGPAEKVKEWLDAVYARKDAGIAPLQPSPMAAIEAAVRGSRRVDAEAPIFYSAVEDAAEKFPQEKGSGQQWYAWISKSTKKEERDWLGLKEFLEGKKSLTKEEVLRFIRENNVEITETVYSGSEVKYSGSIHPFLAAEDYRELLIKIPKSGTEFTEGHWGEPNVLVHARFDARFMDGKRTLFVQEIQSDWHQQGRDLGYDEGKEDEEAINLKKLLQEADQRRQAVEAEVDKILQDDRNHAVYLGFRSLEEAKAGLLTAANILEMGIEDRFSPLVKDLSPEEVATIQEWRKARLEHAELEGYIMRGGTGDVPSSVLKAEAESPTRAAREEKKKAADDVLSRVISDRNGWSEPKPLKLTNLVNAGKNWKLVYDLDKTLTAEEMEVVEEGIKAYRRIIVRLPNAPFKASSSWSMLAFKRILRWAVDNGFEQVAWTRGATQAERYATELRKKIGFVEWEKTPGSYNRSAWHWARLRTPMEVMERAKWEVSFGEEIKVLVKENGIIIAGDKRLQNQTLADVIGQDIAQKIMSSPDGRLEGEELTVGAEGMKGFYDKILPSEVQKYVKKWGGKVEQGRMSLGGDGKYALYYIDEGLDHYDEILQGQFRTIEEAERAIDELADEPEERDRYRIYRENKTEPVWVLPITQEMRDSVSQPQPLFSKMTPPPVAFSSFEDSKAIRNRTILDKWHWYTKFGENLMQLFQENLHIPGLGHYVERVMEWSRDKGAIHSRANETIRFIERTLSKDQMQRVGNFLFEYNKLKAMPSRDEMLALYKKAGLDETGIAVATRVIGDYLSYLDGMEEAVIASIKGSIEDPVRQQERIAEVRHDIQLMREKPYVPQTRFTRQNRYTAVVKTKHAAIYEGRKFKPGDTVRMEAFYTQGEAAKRAAELREEFGSEFTVSERYIPDDLNTFRGVPPAFIDHMKEILDLSPDQLAVLDELKFETSGAQSHKRHFMKRKDIPGYSTDWLRAYAEYFFYGANHLARARWGFEMEKAIKEVRTEANVIANHGGNTIIRDKIWEYLKTHKEYILYPKNEFDGLRALGFIWYLGLVPRGALVNLGQVPFVAFPWMAARFGDIAAAGALIKSFKDVRKLFSKDARGMDPGFKKALEEAIKAGFIDESNASDLAAYSDYSGLARALGGTKLERTIRSGAFISAWMFHQAERWNRRHVFKATYDLAIKNLNNPKLTDLLKAHAEEIARLKGENFQDDEAKAYIVARAAVLGSQYEYAKWNRPRLMQGKRSLVFLFMNYLQNTLWFIKNDPGGLRALVILAAAAGLQGLPGAEDLVSVLRALYRQWTGRDIDPWREVREFAADLDLNPELVLHGMGRYTMGLANEISGLPIPALDLSGSFSLGRIIPGLSALGPPGGFKDKFMSASTDVGGAFVAIPVAIAQALADDNPDQLKRWERAMPTALKMLSRWERYGMGERAEETQYGADIVKFDPMDPMHNAEVMMTALGFTPTRVSAAWEQSRMELELARYWVGRRQNLARAYDYALEKKDREVMADVKRQIREFNAEAPSSKLRITQAYLQESRKQREKNRVNREAGRPRVPGLERESRAIRRLFAPPAS